MSYRSSDAPTDIASMMFAEEIAVAHLNISCVEFSGNMQR